MLKECQTKDLGSILAHGDYNYGLGEPVGDTSTSAIDMIRSFDPSSFGAVSLIKLAHKMYALEKANSSLGQLKGTKKPKIDLDDPDDVAGLRHHVIVHAATGMLRAGVSDAATIPMWDRQAFIRGVEKQCSHDMKAELVAPNDARSINVLRGYVNFLITRIQEVALSLEYLDSALNNGQVTRVDRTVPQLETLAKVTEDYDEFSYLLVAKIKHLLWLVDMQEDPETRGLLLPELECYINSAEQAGVKRSRLSIDFGVDTGASEGTFRPPYNITAFDQLKHTGLDEYAVPDIVCDVVPVDELLRSIRRSGNCEPTSHNAEKYSLPWGADIQQFDVPRVTDERVLSGGSVHGVTRQTYDNGRTTITKQRNTGSPAELPNMVTEASEMKYEAHALRVAGALMPHYFPRLVDDSDASQGLIVMEELLPGSASLKDYLENRPLSASRLMRLSGAIGKFHRLFDEIPHEGFRGDDYFRGLLEYRFGLVDSLPISALVDDLMEDTVGRGIILGGLSPKNIQIDGQQIGLLDLETACVGNRYFDVGFNLGHLVLHAIGLGEEISKLINVYRYGYERANYRLPFENKLLARTVLGSMVYRVSHPEAAYIPTGFDEGRVNSLLNRVAKILDDEDLNMQAIVEALKDV